MSPSCGSHLTASTTESNQWMLLRVPVGAALQWLICSRPPGGTWTNPSSTTTPVSLHDLHTATADGPPSVLRELYVTSMESMQCSVSKTWCLWSLETNLYIKDYNKISSLLLNKSVLYHSQYKYIYNAIMTGWLFINQHITSIVLATRQTLQQYKYWSLLRLCHE